MLVSSQLDWVTVTKPTAGTAVFGKTDNHRIAAAQMLVEIDLGLSSNTRWVPRLTQKHYWMSFVEAESGMQLDIPYAADEVQGLRVVCTGTCWRLKSARELNRVLKLGWRPTRVDVCWNVQNCKFDLHDIYNAWIASSPRRNTIKPKLEGLKAEGQTLALGSRKSDFYGRIYDKGAERGGEICTFLRIEAELKGELVKKVWERDFDYVDALAAFVAGKFGMCEEMGVPYQAMLEASTDVEQTGEIVVGRKVTNRELWFQSQVKPAFLKLCIESPDAGVELADWFAREAASHG